MRKLKLSVLLLVPALSLGLTTLALADCTNKRAAIEYQLQQAEMYGNAKRVAGLRRALNKTNAYCGDYVSVSQFTSAEKQVAKLESKLRDKQESVSEARVKLCDALAMRDSKEISKARRKLQEKQADVDIVTAELRKAQAELIIQH